MGPSQNSYDTLKSLNVGNRSFKYFSLPSLKNAGVGDVEQLPYSLKILLENLLRKEDGLGVNADDIRALANRDPEVKTQREIAFAPARVVLQDFTGVPAVVDLAVMRDAMAQLGGEPSRINPQVPSDLVIDHSVQVDSFGLNRSFQENVAKEFGRNQERYTFLRWGQSSFDGPQTCGDGKAVSWLFFCWLSTPTSWRTPTSCTWTT